jgi:hypothetical protein
MTLLLTLVPGVGNFKFTSNIFQRAACNNDGTAATLCRHMPPCTEGSIQSIIMKSDFVPRQKSVVAERGQQQLALPWPLMAGILVFSLHVLSVLLVEKKCSNLAETMHRHPTPLVKLRTHAWLAVPTVMRCWMSSGTSTKHQDPD